MSIHNLADMKPLAIGLEVTHGTAVAVTRRLHCSEVTPGGADIERIEVRGTIGHRSLHENMQRQGRRMSAIEFTLPFQFTTAMEWLLYGLQGSVSGSASTTTLYAYSSTLPSFTVQRPRGSTVETFIGCRVSRAEFSGAGGGPINVKIAMVGTDFSVGGSVTLTNGAPSMIGVYHDASVSAPTGTAQTAESFMLVIDNGCEAVYGTGQAASEVRPGPRSVLASYVQRGGSLHDAKVTKWVGHSADAAKFHIGFDSKACILTAAVTRVKAPLPGFSGGAPGEATAEHVGLLTSSQPDLKITMTGI